MRQRVPQILPDLLGLHSSKVDRPEGILIKPMPGLRPPRRWVSRNSLHLRCSPLANPRSAAGLPELGLPEGRPHNPIERLVRLWKSQVVRLWVPSLGVL